MVFLFRRVVLFSSLCMVHAAGFPANAVAQYWGQNSAGVIQENLASYCDDSTDILLLSFLNEFNVGDLPVLNFADACTTTFSGTKLLHCPSIAKDIQTCQSKGKKVLLSLGGAAGSYGLGSDDEATTFAQTLYDMFGEGTHKYRPFGDAVVDGFDFDIEGGGSLGYGTLSRALKSLSDGRLLITGAPQCPFPDSMLGDGLNEGAFDAVFVQFYNNYCGPSGSSFNFDTWDHWAKKKNIKVFLGLPGSPTAAGSGYLPFDRIQKVVAEVEQYDSYGGVMFWDASQTYSNTDVSPNLASAVGDLVHDDATPSSLGTVLDPSPTTSAPMTTARSFTLSSPKPNESVEFDCSSADLRCAGTHFASCAYHQWLLQPCPSGLTCVSTTNDGQGIYCGSRAPAAYKSNRVQAHLTVLSTTNATWAALLNARRTHQKPFGSHIVIQFPWTNAPLVSVQHGTFAQSLAKVVLQIKNPHRTAMALVVRLTGTLLPSRVLVTPPSIHFYS